MKTQLPRCPLCDRLDFHVKHTSHSLRCSHTSRPCACDKVVNHSAIFSLSDLGQVTQAPRLVRDSGVWEPVGLPGVYVLEYFEFLTAVTAFIGRTTKKNRRPVNLKAAGFRLLHLLQVGCPLRRQAASYNVMHQ